MAFKYTEEQLNKLDKELLIQLFLGLQEQLEALTAQTEALNTKMQQKNYAKQEKENSAQYVKKE